MAKGDGSITKQKDKSGKEVPNTWRVSVSFGKNPVTGKRKRITRIVKGSKAEARRVRDELKRNLESGLKVDHQKVTVSEFMGTWTESRKAAGNANPLSIRQDRARLRYVEELIGDMKLADVDAMTIESVYAHLHNERNLGGTSLNLIHGALKNMFKKAVSYDLILRNPLDKVQAPRRDDVDRRFLTSEEFSKLWKCLDKEEDEIRLAYVEKEERQAQKGKLFTRTYLKGLNRLSAIIATKIILSSGVRRGEALALTWADVDLSSGSISIDKTVGGDKKVKKPKTKAGIRTISLDEATLESLESWREFQASELIKIGIIQDGKTPVCCSQRGGMYNSSCYQVWWEEFRVQSGFQDLLIHGLRHSQATALLSSGLDIKSTQRRMGIASVGILLSVYAHAIPQNDEKASMIIGSLLKGESVELAPRGYRELDQDTFARSE